MFQIGLLALACRTQIRYNKEMKKFLTLLYCFCLPAAGAFASGKLPLRNARALTTGKKAAAETAKRTRQVEQALRRAQPVPVLQKPLSQAALPAVSLPKSAALPKPPTAKIPMPQAVSLADTETFIRQSAVEIIGAYDGSLMGSGFAILSPEGKLYILASYHVVGRAGNSVTVRARIKDGTPVIYEGTVVANGSYGINELDASLIELPEEAAQTLRPLPLASGLPQKGETLTVWGHATGENKLRREGNLPVEYATDSKIAVQNPEVYTKNFSGFCGSPLLNEKGEVTGIFAGHDFNTERQFAISAPQAVEELLARAGGRIQPKIWKVNGQELFRTGPGENVQRILWTRNGKIKEAVSLANYPEPFDSEHAEELFPLQSGDVLEFEVVLHRFPSRKEFFTVP